MLNNAINRNDLARAARLVRRGEIWDIGGRILSTRVGRVRRTWRETAPPPTNWWNLPWFEERWNRLATGDPGVDHVTDLAERHLGDGLEAVSLGCGSGDQELRWAATGRFRRLVGVDLSAPRIEAAREAARASPHAGVLDFRVGDALAMDVEPASLDAVIGEASLHHLSPLAAIMRRARSWLRPGGLVLVSEFVGPDRFQWTDRQVAASNGLLGLMPARLRRLQDGRLKRRVERPSRLTMRLGDPSEAIESSRILPVLDETFERVELRPLGGTLCHLAFAGIAHNFRADDEEARRVTELAFAAEDLLMASGEIGSDYVVGVWRRPAEEGPAPPAGPHRPKASRRPAGRRPDRPPGPMTTTGPRLTDS